MKIKAYLTERKKLVDRYLTTLYARTPQPKVLRDAMHYSLTAGGKRLRPILALASYEACGKNAKDIVKYASALELIHTYSLVHDDLPAMDDDDLRRGKPTNHMVFGEAQAILAGDALLTEAFRLLSEPSAKIKPTALIAAINDIAKKAGTKGMVAGQAQDILSENGKPAKKTLSFIHKNKTGALITASVRLGALLAGVGKKKLDSLTVYGQDIGLAFQIIDDILDIKGSTEELGKPAGSDQKNNKMTYPALYGFDKSHKEAERLIKGALRALEGFPASADPLRELARYMLVRKN